MKESFAQALADLTASSDAEKAALQTSLDAKEAELTTTTAALNKKTDDMDETIALKNQAIADLATEVERYQKKCAELEAMMPAAAADE